MEPTISAGDVVIIKEQKDYEVKDIITFNKNNMIVTHRIIEKDGNKFTTQGDANNSPDMEPITLDNIEGKVINKISKIGKAILFFQQPIGIMSLVLVLGALEFFFAAKRKMAGEVEECPRERK